MRRALVTGAGGFVGAWLARALLEAGVEVRCLVLDQSPNLALFGLAERAEVVRGDLAEPAVARGAVGGVDACFHLAAQAIVGLANESPVPSFEAIVRGTWNLLEACREAGVERIVVASSDMAYGDQEVLPYTEELPLRAAYPYDASKACADIVARSYARTYGLPVTVSRMANIYGGGDHNFSRIVPGTVRSILLGEEPVIRSDGTPLRDYLYVEDAVGAYLTLAESLPETAGEAFNFGAGVPISALDLVRLILERAGSGLEPRIVGQAKLHGEIDRQYLDSSKAARVLGWRPRTALPDGLDLTLAWYRANAAALGRP
jgi:CDP-glucose 4,6-dehydratase